MDDLLFLAHRIPYPPKKGDKIRSYHLLRFLSQRYRIHLGAFIDEDDDCHHTDTVSQMCAGETKFIWLNPWMARLRALQGLLTGTSLTLPYYAHPEMENWIHEILQRNPIRKIVIYSSALAQFIPHDLDPAMRRIIDFVDVDSLKWDQYAKKRYGLARWIFQREARTLLKEEKNIAANFDVVLFVSEPEANLFKNLAPEITYKIDYWENGVDVDYFSPQREYPNPYNPWDAALVFTGAMNYWPNVDAVTWFAQEIFPGILAQVPQARFIIVGGHPTKEILLLQNRPGVTVIGAVPDVRPWLAWSKAAVAPMRIAQGVQNKILEAMAMARPVLTTPKAMEGIRGHEQLQRWVTDKPELLIKLGVLLVLGEDLNDSEPSCGLMGRQLALTHYNWATNLERAGMFIENNPPKPITKQKMANNVSPPE